MTQPGPHSEAPPPGPPPVPVPDPVVPAGSRGWAARFAGAVAVLLAAAAASAVLGLLAGLLWSVLAPRPLLVVASRGVAYVVNPETNAFIAADGWFCLLTAIGGLICGLAGWFLVVRRWGPPAVAGLAGGGVAASLLAMWVGQQQGLAHFRATLAVSRVGTHLHEPLALGGHGALAFWPLFAALVVGTIELASQSAERKRTEAALAAPPPVPPAAPEASQ